MGIKSMSSDGLIIAFMSLIIFYMVFIFTPVTNPYAQDDSDYEVKSVEDKIYIKYKNYEYLLEKEHFRVTDLFFRDKNGKFVRMITGYQIYSYVKYKCNNLLEKEIDRNKIVKNRNIISSFKGMRQINVEEKNILIKQKKLKNMGNRMAKGLAIFSWIIAFVMFSEIFQETIIVERGLYLAIGIGAMLFGKEIYIVGKKDDILIKKILKGKVYVTECNSYDKKIRKRGRHAIPYIKVKDDNENYIDYWFEIPYPDYNTLKDLGVLKVKLFVIEDEPENQIIIVSPYEEKRTINQIKVTL